MITLRESKGIKKRLQENKRFSKKSSSLQKRKKTDAYPKESGYTPVREAERFAVRRNRLFSPAERGKCQSENSDYDSNGCRFGHDAGNVNPHRTARRRSIKADKL